MRRVATAAALAVAWLVLAGAAPQTSLVDIEDEVMCPVCGVPLNIAQAPQADDERRLINDLVAQGKSKDEIKDVLVAEYGEAVLADPGQEASWLVPALVIGGLLGLVGAAFVVWRRRPGPPRPASALSTADSARLDEDLARYE